ncbi:MAG: FAD-dependent monooxygenase [Simkania sp.]|nr:FAD-dependent monooxygenase [Simkania sp.]
MNSIDALIVGAGPSGLLMASMLVRHGLSCRIIDKNPSPSALSKAIIIQARTLEIFQHIGIVKFFLAEGLPLRAVNDISNCHLIAHMTFDHIDSPFRFALSLEQSKTEQILTRHLSSLGVHVEHNIELLAVQQDPLGTVATLRSCISGEEERLRTSWTIGCDGAHSTVRKALHLPFKGTFFSDLFSLADVHIDWNYPHNQLYIFLNADGVLAAVPLPENHRYRLIFQLKRCRNFLKHPDQPPSSESIPDPTMKEIQAMLSKYAGSHAAVRDPIWMTHFSINSRMSKEYHKERIFLVGDAAHIHSPVGGQGMNTGLQDAFNLAWKLALVHQGKADPTLLASYSQERHTVGKKLLKTTKLASHMATLKNPVAIVLRNLLMSWIMRYPFIQKQLTRAISQIAICYRKSPIVIDAGPFYSGPKAGVRAPNAQLLDQNIATDLYTLLANTTTHHLLLFSGPHSTPAELRRLLSISAQVATLYPQQIASLLIMHEPLPVELSSNIRVMLDPSYTAHRIYRVKKTAAYIIRPDTYIGCRSIPFKEAYIEKYFKQLFTAPMKKDFP